MPSSPGPPLLDVRDLAVSFAGRDGAGRSNAVRGVSFSIRPGKTLAVVGESGSGKSVSALALLGLVPSPPGRIDSGSALFTGRDGRTRDLLRLSSRQLRGVRGREIAMIFQEPMTALNPVYTIGEQIIEAIRLHQRIGGREARARAARALCEVGMGGGGGGAGGGEKGVRLNAYPHEFSGGMRQRVMIAMALACQPRLLLADEPTTALDVGVQKQVLDLIGALSRERGLAVMLITHALGIVAERADTVCVMYAGRVVEAAPTRELFAHPLHPYTRALLACAPALTGPRATQRLSTVADIATPAALAQRIGVVTAEGRSIEARPWWPSGQAGQAYELAAASGGQTGRDHRVGVWLEGANVAASV